MNCICPLGRWHLVSFADLSQPAGVTAVLAEMEMHFCVKQAAYRACSWQLSPGCKKNGVEDPSVASSGSGQIVPAAIHSHRLCRADTGCLPSLTSLKYRRRRKKKRHWPPTRAVCEGSGLSEENG